MVNLIIRKSDEDEKKQEFISQKLAEIEAKKAEREADKAEKQAQQAEKQAQQAEKEAQRNCGTPKSDANITNAKKSAFGRG